MKRTLIALVVGVYAIGAVVSLSVDSVSMRALAWPWFLYVEYSGSDAGPTDGDQRWPEPRRTEQVEMCLETITASVERAVPYCECVMQGVEQEWTYESFRAGSDNPAQRERFEEITESCRPRREVTTQP